MKAALIVAAVLFSTATTAQFWKTVGYGTVALADVRTLYGDSVSDRLLAGGSFKWIMNENDSVLGFGQAAWNGFRWDSLATRIQPNGGNLSAQPIYWYLRYDGRLYASGAFPMFQAEETNNLARLDEQTQKWEGLGCEIPNSSGITTLVPKEPQGTLYATGHKGDVCGYPESCVFRYDGTAFYEWPPFDQIPDENGNYVGTIFDFKGKTYMTCSVPDPDGSGYVSFLRYNGTSWEHVPGWNTLSPIKDISIRNDTLYVVGTFRLDTGGPGNLVASFDGENWSDMGGGFSYVSPASGAALDLQWFQEELWACGKFDQAGGIPAHSIAKWDGQRWCVPPGDFRWLYYGLSTLSSMAVWRDSLYVCGGIYYIDWERTYQVAQWLGGDAMEGCGSLGISGGGMQVNNLSVHQLPGSNSWNVRFPFTGKWSMEVYDAMGRRVHHSESLGEAETLDLNSESPGMYVVRATVAGGSVYQAKLLKP